MAEIMRIHSLFFVSVQFLSGELGFNLRTTTIFDLEKSMSGFDTLFFL